MPLTSRRPLRGAEKYAASGLATAERSDSGASHKALYLNLIYRKRLAYDIGRARLDAFCLVPLSLRSIWRRRVAPNWNKKVENATLKNYRVGTNAMRLHNRVKYFGRTEFTLEQ